MTTTKYYSFDVLRRMLGVKKSELELMIEKKTIPSPTFFCGNAFNPHWEADDIEIWKAGNEYGSNREAGRMAREKAEWS